MKRGVFPSIVILLFLVAGSAGGEGIQGLLRPSLPSEMLVSSPTIGGDGSIYVVSHDGYLHAVSREGTLRWSFFVGVTSSLTTPSVAKDGTVYVGGMDGVVKLHAITRQGTLKWSFPVPDPLYGAFGASIGPDGTVYVGGNMSLTAINPDGTLKWSYQTDTQMVASYGVGEDGTVYLGTLWYVRALNPDGTVKWSYLPAKECRFPGHRGGKDCLQSRTGTGSGENPLHLGNSDGAAPWILAAGDRLVRPVPLIENQGPSIDLALTGGLTR